VETVFSGCRQTEIDMPNATAKQDGIAVGLLHCSNDRFWHIAAVCAAQ
jgi:hypothetical protein